MSDLRTTLARRLSTTEFTRRNVKFDGKDFDPAVDAEWIVEPLEYMDTVRGAIFLLIAAVQSYKSTAAELFNARQIALNPGRMIWYFPTDQSCKDFAQDKWKKLIDSCQPIQRVLYDSPHKNTTLTLDLPFGHFRMCSAGVDMNRNSKSGRDITCDEAWEYDRGWLTDIQARYTSYENEFRLIIPTSGENVGSEVAEIRAESDQRTWHSRCPQCHEDFIPDFRFHYELDRPGGLRFDRSEKVLHPDGTINTAALAETVCLQCSRCRHEHRFTPALQKHLNKRANGARHLPLNPKPKPRVHSWNWNALVNLSWLTLAELQFKAELAQARGDLSKIEVFVRKRAARAWSESMFLQVKTGTDAEVGTYSLGEDALRRMPDPLPPDTPLEIAIPHAKPIPYSFCTLTIDVQQSHFWYLVRAWWPDLTSRLVEYGKAIDPESLRDIQKKYKIKDHGGNIVFDEQANQWTMPDGCCVYLDGNYMPPRVRRLAAYYNWCVFRGTDCREFRHKDGFKRLYSEIEVIDAFEGTASAGRRFVPEIKFANTPARDRFAVIRSIDKPQARVWTYASDVTDEYKKHLGAWVRLEKKHPKTEEIIHEWKQVGGDRDDLFWCEKASIVVASMAGLLGVSDAGSEEEKPADSQSS